MADKLTLTGVKAVTNHTGDELQFLSARKGDTHPVMQWWDKKGQAQYNECTIFNVTRAAGNLRMIIPTNMSSIVTIAYDGADDFSFYQYRDIDRVAIVAEDSNDILVEYVFPSISGGAIMKRTVEALPT